VESCCSANADGAVAVPTCPDCGERGRNVDRITLKALLQSDALRRLMAISYLFCPSATCDVVYFAPSSIFRRQDVVVPIFQKEPAGARTVCYCFAITESDLRREIDQSGTPTAAERITALVKADRCACEVKNPQGTCCLGNVTTIVKSLLTEVVPAR
jgi:CopZ-like zinc binding protein